MNVLEDQIRERMENEEVMLREAFSDAASVIREENKRIRFTNRRAINRHVIRDILQFYRLDPVPVADNLESLEDQLDYCLRRYGMMRRQIRLEKGWNRDSTGPILAFLKKDGIPVALIPVKSGKYYYVDENTGKRCRVNDLSERLFREEAYCFYKPLPLKVIGVWDLFRYGISLVSTGNILTMVLMAAVVVRLGTMMPRVTGDLLGYVVREGDFRQLRGIAVFLICIAASVYLLTAAKNLLRAGLENRIASGMQTALMMRIISLPTGFFKQYSVGELHARQEAMGKMCTAFLDVALDIGLTSLFSLMYLTRIYRINALLCYAAVQVLGVTFILFLIATVMQIRIGRQEVKAADAESTIGFSMISGMKKIRLTGAENRMFAKWLTRYSKWADIRFNPPRLIRVAPAVVTGAFAMGNVLIYLFAVASGTTVADYYAFTVAYGILAGCFTQLTGSAVTIGTIRPLYEQIKPFLKAEPEDNGDKEIVTGLRGRIEAEHLYFRYSEDSPYVLNDVSLKIMPGEYVAIVGETGCGKSTLLRLLLGFETTNRGSVYYDGKDLKNLDAASLRRRIGTVMQNGSLFQGDIYSNILISAPYLGLQEAWKAAEIAGIAEDIRRMPMGMKTIVSEGGSGISGGQKQRIMIARAVAPGPKVLFFDEATSALDNVTQRHVSEALEAMGCTRVVIAHRLSTIRHCDRIVVLRDGSIIEDGTYEELIEKKGYFADLVRRQRLDD